MKTLEMMNIAKDTNKKFKTSDLYYTYKDGFISKTGQQWSGKAFMYVNDIFEIDDWEVAKKPATWQEAIEAWMNNKSFSIEVDGRVYIQKPFNKLGCLGIKGKTHTFNGIEFGMIKHGKWYIED
jgi:hypothetical protein